MIALPVHNQEITWPLFVDAVGRQLRLEPPGRAAYGRLAALHLVGELWGEVALLRAAERFVRLHHVTLAELMDAEPLTSDPAWFAGVLARLGRADYTEHLPSALFRPAAPGMAL